MLYIVISGARTTVISIMERTSFEKGKATVFIHGLINRSVAVLFMVRSFGINLLVKLLSSTVIFVYLKADFFWG